MSRTDRVPLPLSEPRCAPTSCTMTTKCARALALVVTPKGSAPVKDFNAPGGIFRDPNAGTALCNGYVSAAGIVAQPVQRPAHPAVRGL